MGQIFIINDFSQSQPWLHCLLAANGRILQKSGIELAPFNPWSTETTPHHCHLWIPCANESLLAPWIAKQWDEMAQSLALGHNQLVIAHTPWLEAHKYFYETLKTKLVGHAVKTLFIIGNPLVVLEQRHRETILNQDSGNFFADCYLNIPALIKNAKNHVAEDRVCVFANCALSAKSAPQPDIAAKVGAFLGCGKFEEPAQYPLESLFYKDHESRILARIKSVRFNDWPRLNEAAYAALLEDFDNPRGEIACAPLSLRRKIAETLEDMGSRNIPGCDFPFPPTPAFLLDERSLPAGAKLSSGSASTFARRLPEEAAAILRERYKRDSHLLGGNQKILYRALQESIAPEIRYIGEPEPPVELSVLTMTYNHEEYIADCLESVLAQQTDFPVRHIVLDHCSSDGTAAIIDSYAKKHPSIQPVLLSTRMPEENIRGLFERCSTKYAALCDGDDFFTHPLKLQKQVDYLENNPECALCFHPVKVVFENGKPPFFFPPFTTLPKRKKCQYYLADLTKGNFIQTNSVVYRWRFRDGLPSWFRADICPSDWYWHMLHAENGRIGFLPDIMSIYRRHDHALYAHAFQNMEAHLRDHGMTELKTYQVCNEHFENRYFRNFLGLAYGVFVTFFNIAHDTKDSTLLDEATRSFPEFAVEFYRYVNSLNKNILKKRSHKLETNNGKRNP